MADTTSPAGAREMSWIATFMRSNVAGLPMPALLIVVILGSALVGPGVVRWSHRRLLHALFTLAARAEPPKWALALLSALMKLDVRPRLHAFDDLLPFLPVPSLDATAKRFLRSVRPLLTDDEFRETELLMADFQSSRGRTLQEMLRAHAAASNATRGSWLADWWLEFAYLRGRYPTVVNVSFYSTDQLLKPSKTNDPAARAAGLTLALLDFKNRIDTESLPATVMNGVVPIDMSGYECVPALDEGNGGETRTFTSSAALPPRSSRLAPFHCVHGSYRIRLTLSLSLFLPLSHPHFLTLSLSPSLFLSLSPSAQIHVWVQPRARRGEGRDPSAPRSEAPVSAAVGPSPPRGRTHRRDPRHRRV